MMRFIKDENGQGMLEYVLIIALVALVLVGVIVIIRNRMDGVHAADKINAEFDEVDRLS